MNNSRASRKNSARHLPLRFVACNGRRGDGRPCGQMAAIDSAVDVVDSARKVVEIRYVVICPKCGRRLQSMRLDAAE